MSSAEASGWIGGLKVYRRVYRSAIEIRVSDPDGGRPAGRDGGRRHNYGHSPPHSAAHAGMANHAEADVSKWSLRRRDSIPLASGVEVRPLAKIRCR